ncbi:MAG: GTP-binding protein [Erysipelotrichaceae bacterium]|nr:GTP-binding protein [Erysipelotrichaceae bacterium]
MDIPVYLFTGFLESGKTGLITETLKDPDFNDGEKTLLLCFEEGIEEYDPKFLKRECNTDLIYVDGLEVLTVEYLEQLNQCYQPQRVMIEYNGMLSVSELLDKELPIDWIIVQIVATVDASTFESYITNMKSLMYEQLVHAEMIIFNRCSEKTKKSFLRGNVKAINRGAQLIYEDIYGNVNELEEDELPFDLSLDVLDIAEEDYGLWYMDALDHPYKYEHKEIILKGIVYHTEQFEKPIMAIGRYAMVCCENDTSFIGIGILNGNFDEFENGEWAIVKGKLQVDYDEESNMDYLSIVDAHLEHSEPLEQPLVFFS